MAASSDHARIVRAAKAGLDKCWLATAATEANFRVQILPHDGMTKVTGKVVPEGPYRHSFRECIAKAFVRDSFGIDDRNRYDFAIHFDRPTTGA